METKCQSPLSSGGILGLPDRRTVQEIAAAEEVCLCAYLCVCVGTNCVCVFACVCWHVCVCSCMNKSSHSVSNALIVLTPLFFGQIPSTVSYVNPQLGVQVQKKRDCVCRKKGGERW